MVSGSDHSQFPISECILHMHAGCHGAVDTARRFEPKDPTYRSRLPWCGTVSLGKALDPYVNSLSPRVQRLDSDCLCGSIVSTAVMAARGVSWYQNKQVPQQGKLVKAIIFQPLAAKSS